VPTPTPTAAEITAAIQASTPYHAFLTERRAENLARFLAEHGDGASAREYLSCADCVYGYVRSEIDWDWSAYREAVKASAAAQVSRAAA
jgi:hypothetical protein